MGSSTSDPQTDATLVGEAHEQLGRAIRAFLQARTAVESPLFDVPAKMVYGNYAAVHALPEMLDRVAERITPEELGRRLKTLGVPVGLALQGVAWDLLIGRTQRYLAEGWPDRDIDLGDHVDVSRALAFWARATRAYRNDGKLAPGVGGADETLAILPQAESDRVARRALDRGPIRDLAGVRRALGELELHVFVVHAEARDGIFHHGPYDLGDVRVLIVKELTDLQPRFLPWVDERAWLEVPRIVIPMVLEDVTCRFDLFSVYWDPHDYLERVVGFDILVGEQLQSVSEERLIEIAATTRGAQRLQFSVMAAWDRTQKVAHGAAQYANCFQAIPRAAGFTDDEIRKLLIAPFEVAGKPYLERAAGPDRVTVWEHLAGDRWPILPELRTG